MHVLPSYPVLHNSIIPTFIQKAPYFILRPPPPQSAIKQEPGFADATQASRALKYAPIVTSPIAAARVHTLFPEGAGATTSLLVSLLPPDHSHSRLQG